MENSHRFISFVYVVSVECSTKATSTSQWAAHIHGDVILCCTFLGVMNMSIVVPSSHTHTAAENIQKAEFEVAPNKQSISPRSYSDIIERNTNIY